MKKLFQKQTFIICLITVLCFGITALSYGQAVVSINPAEVVSPAVGQQMTVTIKIANGTRVAGYDLTIGYDTSALQYVEITNSTYLPTGAFVAPAQVSSGRIIFAATSLSGAAAAKSGTLATLKFKVLAVKESTLRLTDVVLTDNDGNALSVTKQNANVVVRQLLSTDINRDGRVNVQDLVLVARDLGKTGSRATDLNNDNRVNVQDLVLVARDLGKTTGSGTTTSPVPTDPNEGMVLIPAGEFRMGSNSSDARDNEKPVHSVYVDAFYMDKYEVTNAQYAAFLNAKGKHVDAGQIWLDIGDGDEKIEYVSGKYRAKAGYENHPVVEVSWYGAMAYAAWKGKRLPTEAEWEKAARGGLAGLKYPWGNTIDSTKANYSNHIKDTTAVGKYTANGYGLFDMAGNVWEWCLDEYNANFYSVSPARNPLSGANSVEWLINNYKGVKSSRILRGGSWYNAVQYVRVAYRNSNAPATTGTGSGFRCARAVSP